MATKAAVAYHEAGHAVMAVYCRMGLGSVSIIPGEGFLGVCKTSKQPSLAKCDHVSSTEIDRRLNKKIMVAVAGDVAESLHSGKKNPSYAKSKDLAQAFGMANRICGDEEEAYALVDYLTISTRNVLRMESYWDAVTALAKELLEKKKVSGRKAKAIIESAC